MNVLEKKVEAELKEFFRPFQYLLGPPFPRDAMKEAAKKIVAIAEKHYRTPPIKRRTSLFSRNERIAVAVWHMRGVFGLSIRALAESCGTSAAHIAKIEAGTCAAGAETLSRIAKNFGKLQAGDLEEQAFSDAVRDNTAWRGRLKWVREHAEEAKRRKAD